MSTFRFNVSPEMYKLLESFNNKNKDKSRKEYSQEWEKFIESNNDIIQTEERRLANLGFEGNIQKKLFTSVKYYIGKKTAAKEPKERRQYVHIDKSILNKMNDHINTNKETPGFKPSRGYTEFCEMYESDLIIEKTRLQTFDLNIEDVELKIKKTYKNRYFILCK